MKTCGGMGKKTRALDIIFGTSGWRGELDQDFTIGNVQRVAQGFATYYNEKIKKGNIIVGFDPRKNNLEFAKEISRILAANSIPVKIIIEEPTPTPVLAYLANTDDAITGVINLTASHNRFTDDGFKFSPHHGGAADKSITDAISKYANETVNISRISYESARSMGLVEEIQLKEILSKYVDSYVVPTLRQLKAWESIINFVKSDKTFRLIIDPMQGASARYMEAIYRKIESDVGRPFLELLHGDNSDPQFTEVNGAPNPTELEHIKFLLERVSKNSTTLGIATDGDGDRFGVIDLGGNIISGNEIIALLTYFLANKGLKGVIGKTVATSNFVESVARHMNLKLIETPVGFKWFVEENTKSGVSFLVAGEESAHVGVGPFMKSWDDGIVIGILSLWMVADMRMSLTSYKNKIETILGRRFFYNRESVQLSPELKDKAATLINRVRNEHALGKPLEENPLLNRIELFGLPKSIESVLVVDGLKVVFRSGEWFCIRLSGTENVARIYTEAKDSQSLRLLQYSSRALLGVTPEAQLSELLQATGKQWGCIAQSNIFKQIGFDENQPRLGWVTPPQWEKITEELKTFLSLNAVKGKTNFVFSGMGGSINAVKSLIKISSNWSVAKIYTIDSLDPDALKELLSSIDSLSKTVVIGISKSGTTHETYEILRTLAHTYESQGLDRRDHFVWLTDMPHGSQTIQSTGWEGVETIAIQVDGGTDIGGRFTAPHTLIFLIPLLLTLGGDISKLEAIWKEYIQLETTLIVEPAARACSLAKKDARYFAVVLEDAVAVALETWVTQLLQESLGSKILDFNPKTLVIGAGDPIPDEFDSLEFQVSSENVFTRTMVQMYLLEIFTAIIAYEKGINFVTQPDVENYKKAMKQVESRKIQGPQRVSISELISKIVDAVKAKPKLRFLEVVCYWYMSDDDRGRIRNLLREATPGVVVLVFMGSDWNHHSYQAASKNDETLFVILTKSKYLKKIGGISNKYLRDNIEVLIKIAHATHETLKNRALFLQVDL